MTSHTDSDGTPLVRDRTGELVPDPDHMPRPSRADCIATCRAAIRRARHTDTETTKETPHDVHP